MAEPSSSSTTLGRASPPSINVAHAPQMVAPTVSAPRRTESPLSIIHEPHDESSASDSVPFPRRAARPLGSVDNTSEAEGALLEAVDRNSVDVRYASPVPRAGQRHPAQEEEGRVAEVRRPLAQAEPQFQENRRSALHTERILAEEAERQTREAHAAVVEAQDAFATTTHHHITETRQTVVDAQEDLVSETNQNITDTQRAAIEAQRAVAYEAQQQVSTARQAVMDTKNELTQYTRSQAAGIQGVIAGFGGFYEGARKAWADTRHLVDSDPHSPEDGAHRHLTYRAIRRDSNNNHTPAPPPEAHTRIPGPSSSTSPLGIALGGKAFSAVLPGSHDAERPPDPYRRLSAHRSSVRPPDPYNRAYSHRNSRANSQATLTPNNGQHPLGDIEYGQRSRAADEAVGLSLEGSAHALRRGSTSTGKEPQMDGKILTVTQRLQPFIEYAYYERDKCKRKAHRTGLYMNCAIALQIFFGALTTGLAAVVSGRKAGVVTTIFGGITTMLASYLARTRGSGDPEFSRARAKDLENFLRDVDVVIVDRGDQPSRPRWNKNGDPDLTDIGEENNRIIEELRKRLEAVMGDAYSSPYMSDAVSGRQRGRARQPDEV